MMNVLTPLVAGERTQSACEDDPETVNPGSLRGRYLHQFRFYHTLLIPLPSWPISFPVSALKNIINIVQLWKASKILVGVDLVERAKAREQARDAKA